MNQASVRHTANQIAQKLIDGQSIEVLPELQNDQGYATGLGLQVHAVLQAKSPQVAQSFYKKVLKLGD